MIGLALIFLFGLALSVLVVVWDRAIVERSKRNRTRWLESFYGRGL